MEFDIRFAGITGCVLGLLWVSSNELAAQDQQASQNLRKQSEQLSATIDRLASDRVIERNRAMMEITGFGGAAIQPLLDRIQQGDLDFRIRATKAIQLIALDGEAQASLKAENALLRLTRNDSERTASLANKFVSELFKKREGSARKELRAAGAKFRLESDPIGGRYYSDLHTITFDKDWSGSEEQIRLVRYLRQVRAVELVGEKFDDDTVVGLSEIVDSLSFKLNQTRVTRRGLEALTKQKKLARLLVYYAEDVDMKAVPIFKRFEALTELSLFGTGFQLDQLEALQKELPGIVIEIRVGGFLGIRYNRNSPDCRITVVVEGSAAAKAGMRVGDVIVEYGGETVGKPEDLSRVISKHNVGEQVSLKVKRGDKTLELKARLSRWQ